MLALRAKGRRLLLVHRGGAILAALLAAAVAIGLVDYAARLPVALRWTAWVLAVLALVYAARRWLIPAWRFRPNLTEIALRLESSDVPGSDRLRGMLASAIEFGRAPASTPATAWMQRRAVRDAVTAFADVPADRLIAAAHARMSLGATALALGMVAALFALQPTLATIGAARVLAPWSGAAWPTRTAVADATTTSVHPLGSALPLRAVLTRTDRAPGQTAVTARYHVIIDGRIGPSHRMLLTSQGRHAQTPLGESGELYERLVEPSLLTAAAQGAQIAQIEYWFETTDNRTDPATIDLVEPPSVLDARASITPPAYAQAVIAAGAPFIAGEHALGPGSDSRAVLGPILQGSLLTLTIELNKPVPPPASPDDRAQWTRRTLGDADLAQHITAWGDDGTIALSLMLDQTRRIPVTVQDRYALVSAEESVFTFESVEDRPATAAITDPPEDEAVLATAVIGLVGEGRDDAGVAWVALERIVARPPPGSIGAPASAVGPGVRIARTAFDHAPLQARIDALLDLAQLNLNPGDEVRITAIAGDTFNIEGLGHEPGVSSVRTLRIISEDDLVEQIRRGLAGVRASAIRLHNQQRRTAEQVARDGATEENRAAQAALTEQLRTQRQAIERLADRATRNNLHDRALSGMLEDAASLLHDAAENSDQAQTAMTTGRPTPELTEQESERVAQAQQSVADQLEQLIEMLDRGEDSWLSRRSIERLLDQQRDLMSQTEAAASQTIGRNVSELSRDDRSLLDAIARKQSELADQAAQAMDQLEQRSQQMRQVDPAQADAMAQAARLGQRSQLEQTLDDAAQNIAQNRTQQAQQQQQDAAQALEEMLAELNNADQNRDQALRRVLASAIESIQALITRQETELAALHDADDVVGLDTGMIRLHQSTLGVSGELRTSFRELGSVADLIGEAADAQADAIAEIRADDRDATEEAELESLDALNRALAEAQHLDDEAAQREQDRKLQELRRQYRDLLERQVALRAETRPLLDKDLTRRQRAQARGLAGRQSAIRDDLAAMPDQYEELTQAAVFSFAHQRLDAATGAAAEALRAATINRTLLRRQDSAVRLLRSLVEALKDLEQDSDEFREGESSSGGGSGQGGDQPLIPPIKELLLLRALQDEAAQLTQAINDDPTAEPAETDDLTALQRELAEQATDLIDRMQQQPGPNDEPEPPQ